MTPTPLHLFSRDRLATRATAAGLVACGAITFTLSTAGPSAAEDALTCNGKAVTILVNGLDHGRVVFGDSSDDVILAFGGGHQIFGLSGHDTICTVSDSLTGDEIDGGRGDDYIDAGDGNDSIDGADGADRIFSGIGDDSVDGGEGDDYVAGEASNDRIEGGTGWNIVRGGAGNDVMIGGSGKDDLLGDAGDDHVSGGGYND